MEGNDIALQEADRLKLDKIVSDMVANKESDEDISFVVNDFKSKYGTKTSPESDAKKKYGGSFTIEFGFWYFRINGKSISLRSPIYLKDKKE